MWREPVPAYAISVVIGSGGFGEFGENHYTDKIMLRVSRSVDMGDFWSQR